MPSTPAVSRRVRTALLLPAFVVAGFAVPAGAADHKSYPGIGGSILIEIQSDWTYDSDNANAELNDLFTKTEPTLELRLVPGLSVVVHGVLEPAIPPPNSNDRYFGHHGFFVEDLYAVYETGRYSARIGKFTPNFGRAWDRAPGIYGTDFAEAGYEFTERVGIGGSVSFTPRGAGVHTLSASTFFLDTSVLTESALRTRGTKGLEDGGVSNTEDFSSLAIALDGRDIPDLPNFAYHVAGIYQAEPDIGGTDENGLAVAASYNFPLGEVDVRPFVEYVHLDDAGGVRGTRQDFLTTSVELGWDNWNLALSHTGRYSDTSADVDVEDYVIQISGGYTFGFGLGIDVGWRTSEEDGVNSDTLGALFAYERSF